MLVVLAQGAHSNFFIIPWPCHSDLCPSEKSSLSMLSSNKCPGGDCHLMLIICDRDHRLWALQKPEKDLRGRQAVISSGLLLCLHHVWFWRSLVVESSLYITLVLCLLLQSFSSAVVWIFYSASKVCFFFVQPNVDLEKRLFFVFAASFYILESFIMFLSAFSLG